MLIITWAHDDKDHARHSPRKEHRAAKNVHSRELSDHQADGQVSGRREIQAQHKVRLYWMQLAIGAS